MATLFLPFQEVLLSDSKARHGLSGLHRIVWHLAHRLTDATQGVKAQRGRTDDSCVADAKAHVDLRRKMKVVVGSGRLPGASSRQEAVSRGDRAGIRDAARSRPICQSRALGQVAAPQTLVELSAAGAP